MRNLLNSSSTSTRLPIIAHSSWSNCEKSFRRMATKNTITTPFDFRMATIKSHIRSLSRAKATALKNSSRQSLVSNHTQHSPNRQQTIRDLHGKCLPKVPARVPDPPAPPLPAQSHNQQYEHFLAYLRRQSFARLRRKRQEKEGYSNHIEATIRYNPTKQLSPSSSFLFPSYSNYSLISLTTNTSSILSKQSNRLSTSFRTLPQMMKTALDDPLLTSSSVLITPRNSVVDEEINLPNFYINDDKLQSGHEHQSSKTKHLRRPIVYI